MYIVASFCRKVCRERLFNVTKYTRAFSKSSHFRQNNEYDVNNLRNIGILAHIDAGKTTTTERMLFYSGTIRAMGEVHHGNTVTDYMQQERERGITITAAAVSFSWQDHQFNLIDTPGHIDFTMEVEQSLGVLDGAVIVLDGSAGVEAQTLTVWRQCDGHRMPRIAYINKMDRKDGDLAMCLDSLRNKLEIEPLCLHLPIRDENGKLDGLTDVVNLEKILWKADSQGKIFKRIKLTEDNGATWEKTMKARNNLVDTLSEYDDELANIIINSDSLDKIATNDLKKSIRKVTLNMDAFPILCGSSYKNIGVQMLMDAVIDYLPSPLERNQLYSCFRSELCAKAFKVQHDDQRGVLTFFRIFSGEINKGQKIYNIGKDRSELSTGLYVPYADEYKPVSSVKKGNVAAVSGLKLTMTGDIIASTHVTSNLAKKKLAEQLKDLTKRESLQIPPYLWSKISGYFEDSVHEQEAVNSIFGVGATIPDPVFMCSIEPPSLAFQSALETALAELQREDSSLRVSYNKETDQIILAGMGELHLEVIKQRILSEYKIDVELGPLQISYKETVTSRCQETHVTDNTIGGTRQFVNVTMSVYPTSRKEILKLDHTSDSASNLAHIYPRHMVAIKQGVESGLLHGPKLGCPIINVGATLHWLEIGKGTSETFVAAAISQCLRKAITSCDSILLEPMMFLEIITNEDYFNIIMNDLSRRRSTIQYIGMRGKNKILECVAPLSELLGYSSALRSLSSGTASFTMEFYNNQQLSAVQEEKAIKSIRGF